MQNIFLYILTAFIWGSTWLAIKFQLGVVAPQLSVAYRFCLSAILLLLFCRLSGRCLRFSAKQHFWLFLEGLFLFSFSYWMVYLAEQQLTSGLVSVIFSTILFWNVIWGRVFLKTPVNRAVIIGGLIGILGIILVFEEEIFSFSFADGNSFAFLLCLIGAIIASLGNIVSAHNQRLGIPVFQINAFGMLYGALIMFGLSVVMRTPLAFDISLPYLSSILYLAIFGSIVAFSAFLTLIGRIGADRAGYVSFLFPIIALALSTIFEGYHWSAPAVLGASLILGGNFLILRKAHARSSK